MPETLKALGRKLKRTIFTQGYAKPVFEYLQFVTDSPEQPFGPEKGAYLINISYDLELSISTSFWTHEFEESRRVGMVARENLIPTLRILNEAHIPCNIQIVGMLLDSAADQLPILSDAQREFIKKNPELCRLDRECIALLTSNMIELGIHGYTHRLFSTLSESEAVYEITKTHSLIHEVFNTDEREVHFMSYPRNKVSHTALLPKNAVYAYRSGKQISEHKNEIPRGVWFSGNSLDEKSFSDLLSRIQEQKSSYLLHVWGHFTEMHPDELKSIIAVAKQHGWGFTTAKEFIHNT